MNNQATPESSSSRPEALLKEVDRQIARGCYGWSDGTCISHGLTPDRYCWVCVIAAMRARIQALTEENQRLTGLLEERRLQLQVYRFAAERTKEAALSSPAIEGSTKKEHDDKTLGLLGSTDTGNERG